MIEAFQSIWTKPKLLHGNTTDFCITDHELLVLIISVLQFQKNNGPLKLFTDYTGLKYFKDLNISDLWESGISSELESIDKSIDAVKFWAAGKIFALKYVDTPCLSFDIDFIIWNDILDKIKSDKLCVAHREDINEAIYPPSEKIKIKQDYYFNSNWNWNVLPCNTSFLYLNDRILKEEYINEAERFMKNSDYDYKDTNNITYMVFAEQRLLAMVANNLNIEICTILDTTYKPLNDSHRFTHIWGYKSLLNTDLKEKNDFCFRCIRRIQNDFPTFFNKLKDIKTLNKYINY